MPRQSRLYIPGVPQHIVQRGNNRQPCFFHEQDYRMYLGCLSKAAQAHGCAIHAYVLMTNHVHLLATGLSRESIPRAMQHLGRRYVSYINLRYHRTGTLWEGRYKACLVDSATYVLTCYRYIELNPVRAAMVDAPGEYAWSSYHANACGRADVLVTPQAEYEALGKTTEERCSAYHDLFDGMVSEEKLQEIRIYTQQQRACGSRRFQREVEKELKRITAVRPRGRPRLS
jgi:putative transposase